MTTMPFQIIIYKPEFQNAIVNLWKECNLIVPQNDPVEDIKRKVDFQPELFYVSLLNNEVIGSIMAGYEGHRGWINYLAVAPKHQRKGYGKKLVQKAINELAKMGCAKINLQVRRTNTKVIDFYKNIGFKEDDVVSLGKRLK